MFKSLPSYRSSERLTEAVHFSQKLLKVLQSSTYSLLTPLIVNPPLLEDLLYQNKTGHPKTTGTSPGAQASDSEVEIQLFPFERLGGNLRHFDCGSELGKLSTR